MARWMYADSRVAKLDGVSIRDGLRGSAEIRPVSDGHDFEGFRACQHRAVASAGVIGMPMCDQRASDRSDRIDKKIARGTIKSFRRQKQRTSKIQSSGTTEPYRRYRAWDTLSRPGQSFE